MSNNIARVYQFIQNQYGSIEEWKNQVDQTRGNGDGTLIKTEFRSFMLNDFDFEIGDNENDIINQFWASIDANTTGKVGATGLSNKNALDGRELAKAEEVLKASDKINEFVAKQQVPAGVNEYAWKASVKESLLNKAMAYLKTNPNATAENWDIEKDFQSTCRQTTANYVAETTIKEVLGNIEGYEVDQDKNLKNIINAYIRTLANGNASIEDVVAKVKQLVEEYASTATENPTTGEIEKYGYNPAGKINALQMAKISQEVTQKIKTKMTTDAKYKALYEAYGSAIDSLIPSFVQGQLKTKNASEYADIMDKIDNIVDEFFTSGIKDVQTQYDNLVSAQTSLISYVKSQLSNSDHGSDRKAAVKAVFGTDVLADIEKDIKGYTLDVINTKKAEIEAKIKEVDSMLPDSFLNKLPSTISVVEGGSFNAIQLDNFYGQYNTGDLTFNTTGNTPLSVSSDGQVTVSTDAVGQWTATVDVYNQDNVKVASKQVKVVVAKKLDIASVPGSINGKSFAHIMGGSETNGMNLSNLVSSIGQAHSASKSGIARIITTIASALRANGYDENRIAYAEQTTKNYFTAILDAIVNNKCYNFYNTSNMGEMRTVDFTYVDAYQKTRTESNKFQNNVDSDSEPCNYINADVNTTGIALNYSYQSNDEIQFTINTRVLLEKFMSFYNM